MIVVPKEITSQVADPQHCLLELYPGHFFKHGKNDIENPLKTQPVRFTLAAGNRFLCWAKEMGFNKAQLIPEGNSNGRLDV